MRPLLVLKGLVLTGLALTGLVVTGLLVTGRYRVLQERLGYLHGSPTSSLNLCLPSCT